MQFYALGLGSTGYDNPIGETQTVAVGADAVLLTYDTGLPKTLEAENGQTLYFAYWDGDYTNVTENREIFAIYTPPVTLITYDKTGDKPYTAEETEVGYLSTPDVPPAESPENAYSKAWFMSCEGELISDTPSDRPVLDNPDTNVYEYTYIRYTVIPFTVWLDEKTSCSTNFTLFCPTVRETVDETEYEEDEEIIYEEYEIPPYSYNLSWMISPEEAITYVELQYYENGEYTLLIDELYDVALRDFRYSVKAEGEKDAQLVPFEELVSMLESSVDTPLLITGAEAELVLSDLPTAE